MNLYNLAHTWSQKPWLHNSRKHNLISINAASVTRTKLYYRGVERKTEKVFQYCFSFLFTAKPKLSTKVKKHYSANINYAIHTPKILMNRMKQNYSVRFWVSMPAGTTVCAHMLVRHPAMCAWQWTATVMHAYGCTLPNNFCWNWNLMYPP